MSEAHVISAADVKPERWSDPVRGDMVFRLIFGGPSTETDFSAGVSELEVGGWMGHHRHEPAEIYYVLSGEGVLTIDGEEHPICAGTAAHIPGDSEHAVRNTGNGPLRVFYAFAVGSFDEIEYRFTAEERSDDELQAG
jgi:mannose-6-phosphate isomerase-like protein (cupin superfamily)